MEYTGQRTDLKTMVPVREVEAMHGQQVGTSVRTLSHLLREAKDLETDYRIRNKIPVDTRTLDQEVARTQWSGKELMVVTLLHNLSSVKMPCLVVDKSCIRIRDLLSSSKCTRTPRTRSIHSMLRRNTKI